MRVEKFKCILANMPSTKQTVAGPLYAWFVMKNWRKKTCQSHQNIGIVGTNSLVAGITVSGTWNPTLTTQEHTGALKRIKRPIPSILVRRDASTASVRLFSAATRSESRCEVYCASTECLHINRVWEQCNVVRTCLRAVQCCPNDLLLWIVRLNNAMLLGGNQPTCSEWQSGWWLFCYNCWR